MSQSNTRGLTPLLHSSSLCTGIHCFEEPAQSAGDQQINISGVRRVNWRLKTVVRHTAGTNRGCKVLVVCADRAQGLRT